MNGVMTRRQRLRGSIEHLYDAFSGYRLERPEAATFFDYGPSAEELAGIRMPLRKIPDEVVGSMEFWESGWNGWGKPPEVKYVLPRVAEHVAFDLRRLHRGGPFSLFKCKLGRYRSDPVWRPIEVEAITQFLRAFFCYHHAKGSKDFGLLLEVLLLVGFTDDEISALLVEDSTRPIVDSVIEVLDYFDVRELGPDAVRRKGLWASTDRVNQFLATMLCRLSAEQREELEVRHSLRHIDR
jgi:hypothetical protein